MPLGIVSPKEFESEKNNSLIDSGNFNSTRLHKNEQMHSIITSDVLTLPTAGRDNDVPNVPQSLRKIIGETVATEGLSSAMKLAQDFGLSQATASTYARGEISPGITSEKSEDLLNHINGRKTKVSKRALNKLNMALNHLDDEKLLNCDAVELASVAKSMATVVSAMEPKQVETDKLDASNHFHIYAPQVKQENHYETVVAKDNY